MDIHVGIDVGGTFTDLAVNIPGENRLIRHKLASTPEEPDRAIVDGLAAVLADHGLDAASIVRLSHGTTVGTNALIRRRCGTVAVVTTDGFRDLLEIGRQVRPKVYDIHLDNPKPLVPRRLRLEVGERLRADGRVHVPLDEDGVRAAARRLAASDVDCVVVCFLHSYAFPAHEERAVEILRDELPPAIQVLSSTSVYAEFREYERFSTAVLNGALRTVMNAYLDRFTGQVGRLGVRVKPKVSLSAGGLMSIDMARDLPIRASLSGPAAGGPRRRLPRRRVRAAEPDHPRRRRHQRRREPAPWRHPGGGPRPDPGRLSAQASGPRRERRRRRRRLDRLDRHRRVAQGRSPTAPAPIRGRHATGWAARRPR